MTKHTQLFNSIGAIEGIIGKEETANIVKCVNMHDELVEALGNMLDIAKEYLDAEEKQCLDEYLLKACVTMTKAKEQ